MDAAEVLEGLATDGQLLDLLRASQVAELSMIVGAREEGHLGPAAANEVGKGMSVAANVVGGGQERCNERGWARRECCSERG